MKKVLLKSMMLLCLLFIGMGAWADNVEVSSFSAISGNLDGYISYEASKGTASTAPALNNGEIRVYQSGGLFTVTAKNGATITEVIIGSSMATKVTYAVDGGSASAEKSITADGKLTVGSINATNNIVFTCKGTDKNSRLYVNYIKVTYTVPAAKPYTVTFNAGTNGTCSTTSLTESAVGAGITLPTVTPNTGYDFVGWSTDATPSSANAGTAGQTYNPLSDCTLYAYYRVIRPAGEVFYESFDKNNGTGGNDGQWSGSIASSNFNSDNTWTVDNASGANKCAKFGTGSGLGSAITPAISASGNLILTFKAAAWNGNSESTTLKLSATGATLSASSVTLTKGAWDTYKVNITNATDGFKIKFTGNSSSNSRFFLDEVSIVAVPASVNVTIGATGYATFVAPYNMDFTGTTVTAYLVTPNIAENKVTLSSVDKVPAGTALVVKGTSDAVPTTASAAPVTTALEVSATAITATAEDTETYYYLGQETGVVGFRPLNVDGTLAAGKCFFKVAKSGPARFMRIATEGETTAISAVENSKMNNVVYNLAGQRVAADAKGIVIVNGKKMLNK